ncbi:hypothetical protein HZ994_09315 [Akkermansiaceae bacterium]|nr:hypothetical protein HZ994_09315 [Akkermansiaceae bacterium]
MRSLKVAIIAIAALIAGCDSDEAPQHSSSIGSAEESRILLAQQSLMRARVAIEEFPRLDLIIRATREFVILRQVELSDEPMDWKTQEDLAGARARAAEVLPMIAQFSPMLSRIEEALLDLRGALHRTIQEEDLSSESRAALGECRSLIGGLLDDLRLAYQVLNTPESVYPHDSDYYDPDFVGALEFVEGALSKARIQKKPNKAEMATPRKPSD